MQVKDYYSLLRVEPDADQECLKRAFRSLARLYHPDRNLGDRAAAMRFKEVEEAYRVLSHEESRIRYDRVRLQALLSDSRTGQSSLAEPDLNGHATPRLKETVITITFEQALAGGRAHTECLNGEVIEVTIPRGCRDGTMVRVPASGGAYDIVVLFRVEPHQRFRRDGNHLHVIEKISAMEAMVGTTCSLTNPYGKRLRLAIPPGTQPGHRFRLRGQGVQGCGEVGDLFVEIDVEVPRELSDEQRARLRDAAQQLGLL